MRVFISTLFAGLTLAVPQSYNYQIEVGSSGNSKQPQIFYQEQLPQLQQLTQSLTLDQQGGYQFDNQFLQNAQQQVLKYEKLLKQSQQQELQSAVEQQSPIEINAFIEPSKIQHKPEVVKEQQPEQVLQYEKLLKQSQQQELQSVVEQQSPIEINAFIEPSKIQHKPELVKMQQPEFVIQPKIEDKSPEVYDQPSGKKVSFQKEFFYLSAPSEEYEPPKDLDKQLASLKKNLRVVFIKTPESNGLEKAALQLAQQSANAQTAIYVLTKQHDVADLTQKLQTVQTSKLQQPEVAFIKYRTQEEAEHAQRVIQAQYEALDGPNHINRPDTGVTHNFVGSTDHSNGVEPRKSLVDSDKIESAKPISKYLPAALKK